MNDKKINGGSLKIIHSGEKQVLDVYSGSTNIIKVYSGSKLIWTKDDAYSVSLSMENAHFTTTPGSVEPGKGCTVVIAVNDSNIYKLPDTITVSGATLSSYNSSTGEIVLTESYNDIIISGTVDQFAYYVYNDITNGSISDSAS